MSAFREPKPEEEFCIVYCDDTGDYRFRLCCPTERDLFLGLDLFLDHRSLLQPVDGGPDVLLIHACGPHPMTLWVGGECYSPQDFCDVVFRIKTIPANDVWVEGGPCPPFPGAGEDLFSRFHPVDGKRAQPLPVSGDDPCPFFPNAYLHPDD